MLLLIAEKNNIKNRYQSIDLKSGDLKTARVQNRYIEIECYNKALEEPESGIKCRLEFRSKRLYDNNNEDNKEVIELIRWLNLLDDIAKDYALFVGMTKGANAYLKLRYDELESQGKIRTCSQFVTMYEDFVFTMPQLVDLYSKIGHKSAKSAASKARKEYNIELYCLEDLQKYIDQIRLSAARFLEGEIE